MKLDTTRTRLWDILSGMSTDEVIDYLVGYGLELEKEIPYPPIGVYRREEGIDLIRHLGNGDWYRVNSDGRVETSITWSCFDKEDWWVLVLDASHRPSFSDVRILMDSDGKQVQ